MNDPANEPAPLEDLLYSAGNRIRIANILLVRKETELLPTVLEDLFYGVQMMLDGYCVEKGN